jgi:DNA mismatch endonuclease (patch repair protein)
MQRQQRANTAPELELRRALWRLGLRYRIHLAAVPGTRRKIDIAFTRSKVAVFVDGCYWHGCPRHGTVPKSNREWWLAKLEANRTRDLDTDDRLRAGGWIPIRIWEHEDPRRAAVRVARVVRDRRASKSAERQ